MIQLMRLFPFFHDGIAVTLLAQVLPGNCYLYQGGVVFTCVCLNVCSSVCPLTGLLKNYWTCLYEILWNGWI